MLSSKWKDQKSRKKPYDKNPGQIFEAAALRSEGRFEAEDDTDSVASSRSSILIVRDGKRKTGVSPLNRRKSLRLAMKKESTMKITPSLQSQSTVIMQTPPVGLERMETSTRWTNHRGATRARLESQETMMTPASNATEVGCSDAASNLPRGTTKWAKYRSNLKSQSTEVYPSKRVRLNKDDTELDEIDGASGSSLLKKMSTTWGIRQMLGQTKLKNLPKSQLETVDEVDGTNEVNGISKVGRSKLKRKASQQLSPTEELSSKRGILSRKRTTRIKKEVTIIIPEEDKPAKKIHPKRQLSLASSLSIGSDECLLNRAKRMKVKDSVDSHVDVFLPSKRNWPVHMNAQVIWDLPVVDGEKEAYSAISVYVNNSRCVIGHQNGIVLELDANVVPSKKIILPSCVNSVTSFKNQIIAACSDGKFYDISNDENKVLWNEPKVSGITNINTSKDKIVVSDDQGNVFLLNERFETEWTDESAEHFRDESWFIAVDSTGVYHSFSDVVQKYSLKDGKLLWFNNGLNFCGTKANCALTLDYLYVSLANEVIQIDKYKGKIQRHYDQGSSLTNNVQCIEVGGGLVFAAGHKLVCYEVESGEIAFVITMPNDSQIIKMQYFQARLFCLSEDCLRVLDFTENSIKTGMDGNTIECTTVASGLQFLQTSNEHLSLNRDCSFTSVSSEGSVGNEGTGKPKARSGKLKVKSLTVRRQRLAKDFHSINRESKKI